MSALDRLRKAFPELPEPTLAAALDQNGDSYERALAALEVRRVQRPELTKRAPRNRAPRAEGPCASRGLTDFPARA